MPEHAEAHRLLADVVDTLEAMGASVGEAKVNRARDGDVHVSLTADLSYGIDVPTVEEIGAGADEAERLRATIRSLKDERNRLQDRLDELDGRFDEDDWEALKEDLDAARRERDRLQERTGQLTETINRQAEEISELRGTRDHDIDDRAATIRVTVDGEEHTDVIREREQSPGLPDGVTVFLERIKAHDVQDEKLRQERDELQDRVDELETQLANRQERAKELTKQRDRLRERVEEKDDLVEELQAEVANLEDERDAAIEQADQMESQLVDGVEPDQEDGPPFDPMGKTTGDIEDRVAEIDDPETLRLLRESERTGSHRSSVAEAINSRIDELEDDDSSDEDRVEQSPDLPAGLDDPPQALAKAMAELGESRVGDLADYLDVSKGTVHGRLSALREYDLVDARPAPDSGRAKLYSIASDAGEDGPEGEQPSGAEDTVYVATGVGNAGDDKRYHDDEDCKALVQANNVHEKPRDSVPHHEPCGLCAVDELDEGEVYVCGHGGSTYHSSEECPTVSKAKHVYVKKLDAIEGYNPCGVCAADDDEEDVVEPEPVPESCNWLELPADTIVDDSGVERDLKEILDVVERADGWLQVHKRIAATTTSQTKDLLWELGLRNPDGSLAEDDVLEERVDAIREEYVDGEPVAADGGGEQ